MDNELTLIRKHIKCIVILLLFISAISILAQIVDFENNISIMNGQNDFVINYDKFTKHFKNRQIIKLENKSQNVQVISIKWQDVENTLQYQNKFLYEIKCEGPNCNNISQSQVPVSGFTLLSDVYIDPGITQSYTISFSYKGKNDETGHFKGKLVIENEIKDVSRYERYVKERTKKMKNMDKVIKEYQKLDDK